PYDSCEPWAALRGRTLEERLRALRDPGTRARLVASVPVNPSAGQRESVLEQALALPNPGAVYVMGNPARYDGDQEDTLAAHAARRGVLPVEAYIDLVLETNGRLILNTPMLNTDINAVETMLDHRYVRIGLGD